MKTNRIFLIAIALVVIASVSFAQQQQRRGGPGTPPTGEQSTISGTVVSFSATPATGMPSLVVRTSTSDVTLVLGPYWFLQEAKFEAAAGDAVDAVVIACTSCPSGYAVVSVTNLTKGTSVTLRAEDGIPLWQKGGPGGKNRIARPGQGGNMAGQGMGANGPGMGTRGPGMGAEGNCNGTGPDMTKTATFSGTVKSFEGGPGQGRPTLVLTTAEGDRTFIVAPYRAVAKAGLQLAANMTLTLTAAPTVDDEWVVIMLKDNATGAELALRDATTGLPLGGRHTGGGMGAGMGGGNCGRV